MRSLWSGAISFGLVNIPVKLYAATERQDIKFNYLHEKCHTPIRYQKTCPSCQKEVPAEEIVKGFEYAKRQFVILTEEDLTGVAIEATKTIDIIDFVDLSEIDPIYFDKTYYLESAQTGAKAYQLLKQAMEKTGKIAVAKVVIRSKQVLAVIRVYSNVLTMETIFFPVEIRQANELQTGQGLEMSSKELEMAVSLITSLSTSFQPEKFTNEYRTALWEMIERKIAGKETVSALSQPVKGQIVDLMTALEASIKAAEVQVEKQKTGTGKKHAVPKTN